MNSKGFNNHNSAAQAHRISRLNVIVALVAIVLAASVPASLALARDDDGANRATGQITTEATEDGDETDIEAGDAAYAIFEKTETVYGSLDAVGTPEAVYVINDFTVEDPGIIVDWGTYSAVQNLTSETELVQKDDQITFEAEKGSFYYQGNAEQTTLPWNITIAYKLDDEMISATELAGATGELSIHVMSSQNAMVDPSFYDCFMLQITLTLPGSTCTDIVADDATIASSGEDTTVAFTVLPGNDADCSITMQVQDFEMDGIQIVALPYTSVIDIPDTDEMVSSMDDLSYAINELTEGTDLLADGVDELTSGTGSLATGAEAFGQGLDTLNGSSSTIVNASLQIKRALSTIARGMGNEDFSNLSQLSQLGDALYDMADGLDALKSKVESVQQGYNQAFSSLDDAMNALSGTSVSESDLDNLYAVINAADGQEGIDINGAKATVDQLNSVYSSAAAVKATYDSAKAAFSGASSMFDTLTAHASTDGSLAQQSAALRNLASQLDGALDTKQLDQFSELADGLVQLSNQYGEFHEGLKQYTDGLSTLANNYSSLSSGIAQLASGGDELADGADQLSSGMYELNDLTITLPDTMRDEINEMMADYEFPEYDPVSFVSPENNRVTRVQFALTTAAIELPEVEEPEEEDAEPSMWDRFTQLFR